MSIGLGLEGGYVNNLDPRARLVRTKRPGVRKEGSSYEAAEIIELVVISSRVELGGRRWGK